MLNERPYSVVTLAERWGCTEGHVRNLIRRHELRCFRLGDKLIRILAEDVERYERGETPVAANQLKSVAAETSAIHVNNAIRDARLVAKYGGGGVRGNK